MTLALFLVITPSASASLDWPRYANSFSTPFSSDGEVTISTQENPFLGFLYGYLNDKDEWITSNKFHLGDDYNATPKDKEAGKPIKAIADGRVVLSSYTPSQGNNIVLEHILPGDRYFCSQYFHMQAKSDIAKGSVVLKGDTIGLVGNTGGVKTHLHTEIRLDWPNCKTDLGTSYSIFSPTSTNDFMIVNNRIGPEDFINNKGMTQVFSLKPEWNVIVPQFSKNITVSSLEVRKVITDEDNGNVTINSIGSSPDVDGKVYEKVLMGDSAFYWQTVTTLKPGKPYWVYSYGTATDKIILILHGPSRQKFAYNDVAVTLSDDINIRSEHSVNASVKKIIPEAETQLIIRGNAPYYTTDEASGVSNAWWQVLYPDLDLPSGPYFSMGWVNEDVIGLLPNEQAKPDFKLPNLPNSCSTAMLYDFGKSTALATLQGPNCAPIPVPSTQPTLEPVINLQSPIIITKDSIYFSSHIDTKGYQTNFWYDYGTTSNYTTSLIPLPVNTFSPDHNGAYLVSGLACGTSYHYRVIAYNAYATVTGPDQTASTLACSTTLPPTVYSPVADIYNRAPIAITTNSVYLSSNLDTHGLSTKYYYQYGISNLGEHISAELPVNTYSTDNNASTVIQGLTCATTYRYRIIVTNSAGLAVGPERFVTTSACTPPPPPPTTTLGDFSQSSPLMLYCAADKLQVRLNWTGSANAEGYRVLRDGVVVWELSKVQFTIMDTTTSGTSPRYVVQAYAGNQTKNSNETSVNSVAYCQDQQSTHYPAALTLSPQYMTSNEARLQGEAWYHDGGSRSIWFEYGTTGNLNKATNVRTPPDDGVVFAYNADITCGNNYEYRTVAKNDYATAYGNIVAFSASPCPIILPPSNLVGSIDASGKITLTWQDNSTGENGFRIFQKQNDGAWQIGLSTSPNDTTLSFGTLWYVGEFCYRVTTIDNYNKYSDPSNAVCFTLPVPPVIDPPPTTASPVITHIDDQLAGYNQLLTVTILATDADTKPANLTYTVENLPVGAKLIWNKLYWKPTLGQAGVYPVTVRVSDGENIASQTFTITVTNVAPVITYISDQSIAFSTLLTVEILATDSDTRPADLKYTIDNLPTGAKLIWNKLYWKPAIDQIGAYPVTVRVSDGENTTSQTFTITVMNRAPVIEPIDSISVAPGTIIKFNLSGSDPDGQPLTFSAENLPTGASFNWKLFYWQPKKADIGEHVVTFRVSDGLLDATMQVKITVGVTPAIITYQPTPDQIKDTWWSSYYDHGSNHFVSDDKLRVGGWGDYYWSALQFDLSSLPKLAKKVELRMTLFDTEGTATAMDVFAITSGWDEVTGWVGTLGTQYFTTTPVPPKSGEFVLDITELYNKWQSGTLTNYGLVFKPLGVNHQFNEFRSSDYTVDPTLRPKLVIQQ